VKQQRQLMALLSKGAFSAVLEALKAIRVADIACGSGGLLDRRSGTTLLLPIERHLKRERLQVQLAQRILASRGNLKY